MLQFSPADPPYAGLAQVRELCTQESLDGFAWALFRAWLVAGAPAKHQWAFLALGHLGSDEVASRLLPLLRIWPRQKANARAVQGLQVLASIGTDFALRSLLGLGRKASKGLRESAQEKIDEIARSRGLTAEDLADRLIPDLDLEPDGTRVFGSFRVHFDQNLSPDHLPASAGAEHVAAWKELKKEAKALAALEMLGLVVSLSQASGDAEPGNGEDRAWTLPLAGGVGPGAAQ